MRLSKLSCSIPQITYIINRQKNDKTKGKSPLGERKLIRNADGKGKKEGLTLW